MNVVQLEGSCIQNPEDLIFWVDLLGQKAIQDDAPLLLVTDAWGSSREGLETLVNTFFEDSKLAFEQLEKIRSFYLLFMNELFPDTYSKKSLIANEISNALVEIEWLLEEGPLDPFDYVFDQIVSVGPVLASKVLAFYLEHKQITVQNWDARDYMMTDNLHCMAKLDENQSVLLIQKDLKGLSPGTWVISQNGIGSTSENFTTTFGPKGKSNSAVIFSKALGLDHYWVSEAKNLVLISAT